MVREWNASPTGAPFAFFVLKIRAVNGLPRVHPTARQSARSVSTMSYSDRGSQDRGPGQTSLPFPNNPPRNHRHRENRHQRRNDAPTTISASGPQLGDENALYLLVWSFRILFPRNSQPPKHTASSRSIGPPPQLLLATAQLMLSMRLCLASLRGNASGS